jgi:hypothetical protein
MRGRETIGLRPHAACDRVERVTALPSAAGYPVLVTPYAEGFELQVRELLLVVRGHDLEETWRELRTRVSELIHMAGQLDEHELLTKPALPAPIG